MSSISDSDILNKNPIGQHLDSFRSLLKSRYEEAGIADDVTGSARMTRLAETSDVKALAVELVVAMQMTPLARTLPSRSGTGNLRADLFKLGSYVESPQFRNESFLSLFERVESGTDQEILAALLSLLRNQVATPPTVYNEPPIDTPFKSTSSSQRADEPTHDDLDERILQEINGCVYKDTEGFYEKYFEGKPWSKEAQRIVDEMNPRVVGGRWTEYPERPSQGAFLDWFFGLQNQFITDRRSTYHASLDLPLAGSECKRKPDIYLAHFDTTNDERHHNWTEVQVIGELKQSLYSSEQFDIHHDPHRFLKITVGYTLMSDEELGLNTYIKKDKIGRYIEFKQDGRKVQERLYLEDSPIASRRAIVCRGTACYRAKRKKAEHWEYVVKFAWRSSPRRAEGDILQLAKERKVWGIGDLSYHRDLEMIATLREGLQFGKPKAFRSAKRDSISQTQSRKHSLLSNALGISLVTIGSSSGQKRKRQDEMLPPSSSKRSRSDSLRQSDPATPKPHTNGFAKVEPTSNCANTESRDKGLFDNRIFSCLVISPPGRSIHGFTSVKELLEAFCDCIKAHESLYLVGQILHRDISDNNVIITKPKREGDPRGRLIDLDLSKELDGSPSGARHRTGTMEFMAIEVLEGKSHTYRHDLESLFYVFLWVIIRNGQEHVPNTSHLRSWYRGSYAQIAAIKTGHMDKKRFTVPGPDLLSFCLCLHCHLSEALYHRIDKLASAPAQHVIHSNEKILYAFQ
ncbi:hypothetical protein ONZ43_g5016 [Nemania bipapillata]|uniref:Uncharacterized protein n=1 Tax=Nemania bipapillata TaxID=110536 RepID=A0ACC2IFT3_9PEZI|nr:hypothetical protein ONZ43_g5016 [Nemania bipapillata]